jgi:hypothetical protein
VAGSITTYAEATVTEETREKSLRAAKLPTNRDKKNCEMHFWVEIRQHTET